MISNNFTWFFLQNWYIWVCFRFQYPVLSNKYQYTTIFAQIEMAGALPLSVKFPIFVRWRVWCPSAAAVGRWAGLGWMMQWCVEAETRRRRRRRGGDTALNHWGHSSAHLWWHTVCIASMICQLRLAPTEQDLHTSPTRGRRLSVCLSVCVSAQRLSRDVRNAQQQHRQIFQLFPLWGASRATDEPTWDAKLTLCDTRSGKEQLK